MFNKIKDIVIKTFISVEGDLKREVQQNVAYRTNCFQLFGFDVMIDDKLNVWLLEVNLCPSLAFDSPLDLKVKGKVIADLFSLAGIVKFEHQTQPAIGDQN